jgi:splicing factor U2AF subunit
MEATQNQAELYGTEKDKFNCPFYWKIGACRHGERCTRQHNKPVYSTTLLIPHMYPNPVTTPLMDDQGNPLVYDPQFLQEHFEDFYEDVFEEFSKAGEIDELNVCDNVAEHLLGNVYVKYFREDDAQTAMNLLKGRFYAGRIMAPEFSPVTDFREARCRQYEQNECLRSGMCNFMHLKRPTNEVGRRLFGRRWDQLLSYHDKKRGGGGRAGGERERGTGGSERDFKQGSRNGRGSPERRNSHRRRSRSSSPRGYRGSKRGYNEVYDDGFGINTVNPTSAPPPYESDVKRLKKDSHYSYPTATEDQYQQYAQQYSNAQQQYAPEHYSHQYSQDQGRK